MVIFFLNSPPFLVSTVILGGCKEWTRNMMARCDARSTQLTSKTISNLLFKQLDAWAICNVEMMDVISFFLTNVKTKQLGVAILFMTLKEIVLFLVHFFVKFVITSPSM
jgi:hypothetical protein